MERRLYIDVGSTWIKWREDSGEREGEVKKARFPDRIDMPSPFYEVRIDEIVRIIEEIIEGTESESVYISVQMHGYLLGDRRGNLLTEYISWQDKRGKLVEFDGALPKRSGTAIKDNLPLLSINAMKTLKPEIYGRFEEFFTLGSYIAYRLTGNNVTHITDAAATGFYDSVTCKSNVEDFLVPCAMKEVCIAGRYKDRKIYSPVGDQQASVLGAGGDGKGYILNIGTAAQVCAIAEGYTEGEYESRPYFKDRTLCTVTNRLGGAYLRENEEDPNLVHKLKSNYGEAIERLPKRDYILVTGGAMKYYGDVVKEALKPYGLEIKVNDSADALSGLKKLAEEI